MRIRCIVIDDKPLAVDLLKEYITKIPFLELRAATTDAVEGLELITKEDIALVFLDIQMPNINGLRFINLIDQKIKVILTTAYSEFALKGYELNVVDYLLKPFGFERFKQAAEKALRNLGLQNDKLQEKVIGMSNDLLFVKTEHRIQKINLTNVIMIQGLENYVSIVMKNERLLSLQTMKRMEDQLPSNNFVRVHRSYIVSINQISHIERNKIVMSDGFVVPVGTSYRDSFLKLLEGN